MNEKNRSNFDILSVISPIVWFAVEPSIPICLLVSLGAQFDDQ